MFLRGIRIYNYRSIDSKGVELDEFGKVNVLIGKNNSGKSNVLRFISYIHQYVNSEYGKHISSLFNNQYDLNNYELSNEFSFHIKHNNQFLSSLIDNPEILAFCYNLDQEIWIEYEEQNKKSMIPKTVTGLELPIINYKMISNNNLKFKEVIVPSYADRLIEGLSESSKSFLSSHKTYLIENYRKISSDKKSPIRHSVEERSELFNGSYFVDELKKILYPEGLNYRFDEKSKLFKSFLKDVLNNHQLDVSISSNNNIQLQLAIESNSRRPIDIVGTGLHQLIILAFTATNIENSIICIEEPEIFIHPEVQRKFIRYLVENTNNQYFITTHSNAFINEDGLDIYRVWHDGNRTLVEKAIDSNSKNHILDDLGYQASDLLQTNFIIWVEGPSDRIYIRHWINIESNNKLIEGIHYTIMFYGGRLLSHLSIEENDDEVSNFININKINRNAAIFIDSDKKDIDDSINPTKERVITEFTTQKKQYILTEGREIENYIDIETLNAALTKINRPTLSEYDLFTDIFIEKNIDKMKLAKGVIEISNEIFDIGNLKEEINQLVVSINKANNLAV